MSYFPKTNIAAADTMSIDAFGRWRVSSPISLFDSKRLDQDTEPFFWSEAQTTGSGTSSTFNADRASTTLAVGASTAGTRVRQTKQYFVYQPGKSKLVLITFLAGAAATGITREIGHYTSKNGIFVRQTASGVSFVIRSFTGGTVAEDEVAQTAWNVDKMNGTGPSGLTLDFAKNQIFWLDMEWLGVGRVRCGFVVDGNFVHCHSFTHSNKVATGVYMTNPNLPIRYLISNDGTGGAATLECLCSSVSSEGGYEFRGMQRAETRRGNALSASNDALWYGVCGIKRKEGREYCQIKVENMHVNCTSTADINVVLALNPGTSGGPPIWNNVPGSALQFAMPPGSITFTPEYILDATASRQASATDAASIGIPSEYSLGRDLGNKEDEVWVLVQRVVGGAETYYGGIGWVERT